MLKKIIILLSLGVLASCVGTLEDTTKKLTDATIVKPVTIAFSGITKGVAVAHNTIQLYFKPASGGSGNYSYLVYLDGNLSTPVASVSQSELTLDKNGEYSLPVTGLSLGTNYTFLVRAFDPQYNVQDSNNVQVIVQTLSYKTPIFSGIQSLINVAGKEGENALVVGWNAATPASTGSSGFGVNVDTISGYNIYVGDSEDTMVFYASVNDPTATSFKLSGLDSGKLYYVRVRAKNSQTVPVEDLNLVFLTKKTLTHLPILFGGVTEVTIPSTSQGFSTINVKWVAGSGNYDRYKIYARKDAVSSFNQASTDYLMTTITDLSLTQASITVTDPHTVYYVAVVACSDSACTEAQGQNVIKYVKTSPPVASFNGIKTLAQPTGGSGLSELDLTWDLPDSNTGVYDEIRVFKTDAAGNFNPYLDRVDNIDYNASYPNTVGAGLRGSTFLQVKGLATGTQACFVALAYSTSPIDVANPDGRTGVARVVKCATPQYNIPGFTGVKLTCTNKTAKSFKISWDLPNPTGTYEDFEIFYKASSSGFVIADAIAGVTGYSKATELSNVTNHTLTNLLLNTTYQILVKSHFHNPVDNLDYRDNNSIIATCSTGAPTITQGPWFELFAIGPKFDGPTGMPIPEKLTPQTGAIDGKTGLGINKPEWRHQYPVESPGTDLGVSESVNGIIRLTWEDMKLSDDLGLLRDYSSVPDTGYKVYRVAHNSLFGSSGPSIDDTAWGSPINTGYIQARATDFPIYFRNSTAPIAKTLAQFVDYSLVHPYTLDSNNANVGTIYWYKIEPWYNGKKLAYSSIASDAVVKMLLPPKNMAFVHRWMSNKQICEDAGLPYSRSNNYKCEYNGLGAIQDPVDGHYYYDMKGDLLVDRFEMGCNFSRGGTAYACTNTGAYPGFEGAVTDVATGTKVGDCVARSTTSSPDTKITAKQGAVFYNRYSRECYVNTSAGGTGTSWKTLSALSGYGNALIGYSDTTVSVTRPVNKGLTVIPPTYGTTASTNIPVTINNSLFSQFSQGQGYGEKIYSNNANLPPLVINTDQLSLQYTCQSKYVTVNGSSFLKRLARRKEFIIYSAETPYLSPTERSPLEAGSAQRTYDNSTVVIKNYLTMPISEHNDRDCNQEDNTGYYWNPADGKKYNDSGFTSWTGQYENVAKIKRLGYVGPYPNTGTTLNYADPRWANGGTAPQYAFLATGSGGPLSTEACVSRYGIQDTIGNAGEWTSDLLYCDSTYGCSMGFKDKDQTQAYTPPIDPEAKETWLNPNGVYFNVVDGSGTNSSTTSMGAKMLPKNTYSAPTSLWTTNYFCFDTANGTVAMTGSACTPSYPNTYASAKYFNIALGIPLDCGGDTCTYLGADDSNTLVTYRTQPASSSTLVTNFQLGTASAIRMGNFTSTGLGALSFTPIASGGSVRSNYGRYSMEFMDIYYYYNQSVGGRCDVLLPESY
jgi:hypothetical protein